MEKKRFKNPSFEKTKTIPIPHSHFLFVSLFEIFIFN